MVEITRCDVRIPNHIYEQIESLAVANGAGNHHRSNKPIVTPTILDLLQIGLAHYDKPLSDKLPDTNLMDEKIAAAIAPIIARLEKLEQPSNTGIPVTESEQAEQPLLDYLETNQAIVIDPPSESIAKKTEKDLMENHPETTIKPIAGDFSGGLTQAKLQRRLGLKMQAI